MNTEFLRLVVGTPEQCPYCASVQTALNWRVAMLRGTLELLQIPIRSACDFVVHIYAPQTVHLDYAIVFKMHVFEQPAWSHTSCVDRGIWTPTTLYPPSTPCVASVAGSTTSGTTRSAMVGLDRVRFHGRVGVLCARARFSWRRIVSAK